MTYQYKHYGKKGPVEDTEGIVVDDSVEESNEEDWRIELEDDDLSWKYHIFCLQ